MGSALVKEAASKRSVALVLCLSPTTSVRSCILSGMAQHMRMQLGVLDCTNQKESMQYMMGIHWLKPPVMRALMSPWVARCFTWVLRCLQRTACQQPWRPCGHGPPLHQQHCYQPHYCQLLPSACPMWVCGCQQEALETQGTALRPQISAKCVPTMVGRDLRGGATSCGILNCSCVAGDGTHAQACMLATCNIAHACTWHCTVCAGLRTRCSM